MQPTAASATTISGAEVNAQPFSRPGEALEVVPGLIVTQHSGEGKANQYFLRGFNLDHGTDLAISVDGMPVNMPTHGHGQGYADINFMIPELIQSVNVRKGPYFADVGDFGSAGAVAIDYINRLPKNILETTNGTFGYHRALAAGSTAVGAGTLLAAVEGVKYNGPWDVPDNVRKLNGVLRYSQGTATDGLTLSAMAYSNGWNSTDQVAQRAIDQGLIGRFGSLDPTDGGVSSRFSLSSNWAQSSDYGQSKVNAYAINSSLRLYNNFTYFLDDPVNGDQFSQTGPAHGLWPQCQPRLRRARRRHRDADPRRAADARRRYPCRAVQDVAARDALDRARRQREGRQCRPVGRYDGALDRLAAHHGRHPRGLFCGEGAERHAAKFRQRPGVDDEPEGRDCAGAVVQDRVLRQCRLRPALQRYQGATITVDPIDKVTPQDRVPLLVRSKGAEIGIRTGAVEGLTSSLAVFVLDFDSELLFVGDAGTTEPSRPSRRVGVEWTNQYQILPWMRLDLDVAYTRARFTDFDPAGNFIPGAPAWVAAGGVTFGGESGWFGAFHGRYFGPRPLIEDDSVRSQSSLIFNARAGYKFDNGLRLQLDVYLFNAKTNQIEYYYLSRLPGEPIGGVADQHVHPAEPLAVRLTLAGRFS